LGGHGRCRVGLVVHATHAIEPVDFGDKPLQSEMLCLPSRSSGLARRPRLPPGAAQDHAGAQAVPPSILMIEPVVYDAASLAK
jgi:hypothetical protein